MLRSIIILAAIGAALIAAPVRLPAALGTATIADPQPGQALRGVVLIRGTAQQPAFDHYEVSFSYEPNPTADWFAIKAAGSSPVQSGQLASWDTTQIADGAYQLRLRVFSSDGGAPLQRLARVWKLACTPARPPSEPVVRNCNLGKSSFCEKPRTMKYLNEQ